MRRERDAQTLWEPRSFPLAPPPPPSVLVVDTDAAFRKQLVELGRSKLLTVSFSSDPDEAFAQAKSAKPSAALIDAGLGARAARLAQDLRSSEGLSKLPIAFVSKQRGVAHRLAAARAGAVLFLAKPVEPHALGAALEHMLAQAREPDMRVLVIDDDPDFATAIAAVLEPEGIFVGVAPDATHLIESLDDVRPDLILLDAMLPSIDGWDAVRIVRAIPEWREVPILFLTSRTDVASRVAAFEAGADDFLAKPLAPEELIARVRARLDRRRVLRDLFERDPLTRCLSRRALLEALARRLSEARRRQRVLSAALIDVDRFKRVNDVHGHLVGDQVLAALGRLLNERFRLEDIAGRWGGEEFVVVLPDTDRIAAAAVLSRVLDEFRRIPFRGEGSDGFYVTFSAGIASFASDGSSVDDLLRAADLRLYEAKHAGRNRVVAGRA